MPPPSPRKSLPTWEQHKKRWRSCTDCYLHETRKSVVLVRGTLPCDVLFVGEAPGESEDVLGQPFQGPAGKVLDAIARDAREEADDAARAVGGKPLRFAFTNLVACIPRTGEGAKAHEPDLDCIHACSERLTETFRLARPRLLVCVGSLSTRYAYNSVPHEMDGKVDAVNIHHPAFILRSPLASRGLLIQQCTAIVRQAIHHNFLKAKRV